nr:MAG TPA: hypothetical protein [Bacteriophage sp.]
MFTSTLRARVIFQDEVVLNYLIHNVTEYLLSRLYF